MGAFFDALGSLVKRELGKQDGGVFTLPHLVKMRLVNKPETESRVGMNPFTGEEMTVKAKPARNVLDIRVLKPFLEMVNEGGEERPERKRRRTPSELSRTALGGKKGAANRGKKGKGDWKLFSTAGDGCDKVARASDGTLSSKQVRILRALQKAGKPLTMAELKPTQECRPDKSLGGVWQRFLMDLIGRSLVDTGSNEDGLNTYSITPAGKALLEEAEKVASSEESPMSLGGATGAENQGAYMAFSVANDGCKEVARASNGRLSTQHVRILRALNNKPTGMDMDELKVTQGIRPDKSAGQVWNYLGELVDRKLVLAEDRLDNPKLYTILPAGKALLEEAEAAAERAKG
jgi:hypothetical protein